jgi:lipopolysaccharide transport system permease protein
MSTFLEQPLAQQPTPKDAYWTTIITSKRNWFDWHLRQLWNSKDLIRMFVWRDFVATYKQTILGPLWYILQPLLTSLTYTIIFGKVARIPTDGIPPFLFYMSGTLIWSYFANTLTKVSNTFLSNAHLLGKVYFHRLAIPISIVLSNFISFAIQLLIFLAFWIVYFRNSSFFHPIIALLVCPILLLMLALLSIGCGILVSALTTRYRDLSHLVAFAVPLLMYSTTTIYPLSSVPVRFRWIVAANPITPIIECFRYFFLGTATVTPMHMCVSLSFIALILVLGMTCFARAERTFIDTV